MPSKGENGGYKYKAFFDGEWHDLTLSDSPNELTEWLQSSEEWTRVKYGHWEVVDETEPRRYGCSVCKRLSWTEDNYCPHCGAKMDEVEDGKVD